VIFDEIQNTPDLVSYVQAEADRIGRNSLFVLTGIHQPALQAAVSQSLAGRTGILELLPLSLEELKTANGGKQRDQWMFDGFMPRLYNNGPEPTRLYADYFRTYVERDVRQIANLRNLRQFETFIRLLAGRVAQLLNLESLASDMGISATTLKEWLSLLEASYVIRILRPYYRNFGKRFIKAPKIYFTETGLVTYLLGIKSAEQIATHPLVGSIFENMVVMEAFKRRLNRGEADDLYFLRTSHGVEVDIAWENNGKLDLCEIKAGSTFHDDMAKNIRAIERLLPGEIGRKSIVYSGRKTSTADGIQAMPFDAFCF
jgi:predicted AAA+ superfamily ATPase